MENNLDFIPLKDWEIEGMLPQDILNKIDLEKLERILHDRTITR